MKRVAVTVAVVLALALALALGGCGDDGAAEVAPGGGLVVDVEVPEPLVVGEVVWRVTVENRSDDDLTLEFSSGQRADVQLLEGDEVAYTWSAARSFIQAVGEETIPAGDRIGFDLEDVLEVDPGDYELVATVTATDEDLSVRRRVAVARPPR